MRVLTYYGVDNQIDGIVLDVLLRKHKKIRSSLGISVPVPGNTEMVVEAIFEGLLLRESSASHPQLSFDFMKESRNDLHAKWDDSISREKRSRTLFAQESIKVKEVATEIEKTRAAVGGASHVKRFVYDAFQAFGAAASDKKDVVRFDLQDVPEGLKDVLSIDSQKPLNVRFDPTGSDSAVYLHRTHPMVEALAGYLMDTALDTLLDSPANTLRRHAHP